MPQTPEERLAAAGHRIPDAPKAVASYVPFVQDHELLIISGQVPFVNGEPLHRGLVGEDISLDQAIRCAEVCALNGLAQAKHALGSLARVLRVLRVGVFVACGPEFKDHPKVGNGASDLLVTAFGDVGRHARAAVGCSSLPLGVPVEVDLMLRVEA